MKSFYIIGRYTPQIEEHLISFFKKLGVVLSFKDFDEGKGIRLFKSLSINTTVGKCSPQGVAYPKEKIGLIVYPQKYTVRTCLGRENLVEPLDLFALVTLHEYLHILGLEHCGTRCCLMAKIDCEQKNGYCLSCITKKNTTWQDLLCKSCKEALDELSQIS